MSTMPRLAPLASCFAVAFAALASPLAAATNLTVSNCSDSGAGSLRAAIASAGSGDTVVFDTVAMNCSTITLTSGQIAIPVVQLTLQGPTTSTLTIGGFHASRVFEMMGPVDPTRKLTINNLTIANGTVAASVPSGGVRGGCIQVFGDVTLFGSTVTGCVAKNYGGSSYGGGVSSFTLHMQNSTISNSQAYAAPGYVALGGGFHVQGDAVVSFSTISGNSASASSGASNGGGFGGGLFSFYSGNLQIVSSTISGNSANVAGALVFQYGPSSRTIKIDHSTISGNNSDRAIGAVQIYDSSSTPNITANIVDSTISGNHTSGTVGGIYSTATLAVSNSTIAFNSADVGVYNVNYVIAAGLFTHAATLQSSIIAKNTLTGGTESDLSTPPSAAPMLGSNNLIMTTLAGTTAPPGTLTADPLLGALANNGGPTMTRALPIGSPAIRAGNNLAGLMSDQRGPGFGRVTYGKTDIGAFQTGDGIFADGFE